MIARASAWARAALRVELSEMGDGLLDDLAADADAPDELPVPVDLPVLPARRVTEVHCLAYRASPVPKSINLVATTRRFRGRAADAGERYERRDWVAAPFKYLNCGSCDLGYWPPGSAFCIFFGPTPMSRGSEIRPASPVNVFGKIVGDATAFKKVRAGTQVRVERA